MLSASEKVIFFGRLIIGAYNPIHKLSRENGPKVSLVKLRALGAPSYFTIHNDRKKSNRRQRIFFVLEIFYDVLLAREEQTDVG